MTNWCNQCGQCWVCCEERETDRRRKREENKARVNRICTLIEHAKRIQKEVTPMRITRIDVEGEAGRFAIMTRKRGSETIEVEILVAETPNGRIHHVQASDEDDLASMADCLQHELRGGNRADYQQALRSLAD
jgi:hypothetical protein